MINEEEENTLWPSILIGIGLAIKERRDSISGAMKKGYYGNWPTSGRA
jgi:hypothetical protein